MTGECIELMRESATMPIHECLYDNRLYHLESKEEPGSKGFYLNILGICLCTLLAACAAGMTLGLMSLDPLVLAIKKRSTCKTKKAHLEKGYAERLIPLRSRHHLLLVTLLLMNASANEALPIFFDNLVETAYAILLSVVIVLFMGEIIPSAIFTGKSQLRLASAMAPVMWFAIAFFSPIAWPLSKMLDLLLGHEGIKPFKRSELKTIFDMQKECTDVDAAKEEKDVWSSKRKSKNVGARVKILTRLRTHSSALASPSVSIKQNISNVFHEAADNSINSFNAKELKILSGALEIRHRKALDVVIPWSQVYALDESETKLTSNDLKDVIQEGHSRIPIYTKSKECLLGVMLVKELVPLSLDGRSLKEVNRCGDIDYRIPLICTPNTSLLCLLKEFQKGASHMAIVVADKYAAMRMVNSMNEHEINVSDLVKSSKTKTDRRKSSSSRRSSIRSTNFAQCKKVKRNEVKDIIGIICLEDLVEVLLQDDIWDEHDPNVVEENSPLEVVVIDNHNTSLLKKAVQSFEIGSAKN